jgi:hypothetical protein
VERTGCPQGVANCPGSTPAPSADPPGSWALVSRGFAGPSAASKPTSDEARGTAAGTRRATRRVRTASAPRPERARGTGGMKNGHGSNSSPGRRARGFPPLVVIVRRRCARGGWVVVFCGASTLRVRSSVGAALISGRLEVTTMFVVGWTRGAARAGGGAAVAAAVAPAAGFRGARPAADPPRGDRNVRTAPPTSRTPARSPVEPGREVLPA